MLLLCADIHAQQWDCHFISSPKPDSTSQILFRKSYIFAERPHRAMLSVVSAGLFDVYVNGINVTGDVIVPYQNNLGGTLVRMTYDVARFLRTDSNIIAVRYSPLPESPSDDQLSLTLYGLQRDGSRFAFPSDSSWLCRTANAATEMNGDEWIDGNDNDEEWNTCAFIPALWMPTKSATDSYQHAIRDEQQFYMGEKIVKIMRQKAEIHDGESMIYDFGRPFRGWTRITIRNAKRGEVIHINGLTYICNGAIDEQACRKFTVESTEKTVIYGDDDFRPSQIQNVEGIEIEPYFHHSWRY
jgi:hypothetical protein